jgi:hypothetical protein
MDLEEITMDLVQQFLDADAGNVISELTNAGFSRAQAKRFIPAAISSFIGALQSSDLSRLLNADGREQLSSLLISVDVSDLAERLDIGSDMACAGLGAIIPRLLIFIKANDDLGSLLSMLVNGGTGNLANLAGELFH